MCVRDNMLERHNEPRAERSTYEFADLAELFRISYILRENSFSSTANKKYPIFKARCTYKKVKNELRALTSFQLYVVENCQFINLLWAFFIQYYTWRKSYFKLNVNCYYRTKSGHFGFYFLRILPSFGLVNNSEIFNAWQIVSIQFCPFAEWITCKIHFICLIDPSPRKFFFKPFRFFF